MQDNAIKVHVREADLNSRNFQLIFVEKSRTCNMAVDVLKPLDQILNTAPYSTQTFDAKVSDRTYCRDNLTF